MNEFRKIQMGTLRALAIRENWFTYADNDTYGEWLQKAHDANHIDTALMVELAETVKQYSDTKQELSTICFIIARECYTVFTGDND